MSRWLVLVCWFGCGRDPVPTKSVAEAPRDASMPRPVRAFVDGPPGGLAYTIEGKRVALPFGDAVLDDAGLVLRFASDPGRVLPAGGIGATVTIKPGPGATYYAGKTFSNEIDPETDQLTSTSDDADDRVTVHLDAFSAATGARVRGTIASRAGWRAWSETTAVHASAITGAFDVSIVDDRRHDPIDVLPAVVTELPHVIVHGGTTQLPGAIVRRKRLHDGSFLTTLELYEARDVSCTSNSSYRVELLLDPDHTGSPQPWLGINTNTDFDVSWHDGWIELDGPAVTAGQHVAVSFAIAGVDARLEGHASALICNAPVW